MNIFLRKMKYLFKWNRMNRKYFNILNLILVLLYIPLFKLSEIWLFNKNIFVFYFIIHFSIYASSMFSRIHDIGKSYWILLLFFIIPWFPIYLMIKKWTVGKNNYGEDPSIIIHKIETT